MKYLHASKASRTDSPYVTTTGDGSGKVTGPLEYNTYGRQMLFGVTYKY